MRRYLAVLLVFLFLVTSFTSRVQAAICSSGYPLCIGKNEPVEIGSDSTGKWICHQGAVDGQGNVSCGCAHQLPNGSIDGACPTQVQVGSLKFADLNAAIFGTPIVRTEFTSPRGLIGYLLPYLFVFAGLILFVMLVWGGYEMLLGASDPKQQQAGQQRITAALIGFILIFASYWLAQLVEKIFGVSIVGTFGKGP